MIPPTDPQITPRLDEETERRIDPESDKGKCIRCDDLFAALDRPEGSVAEALFDAYDHTGHFPSCPDFPRRSNG